MIISYGKRFKNIESTWYFGRLYLYLFLGLYYLITYSIMIQKTFQKLFLNFTFKINNVFIDLKKKIIVIFIIHAIFTFLLQIYYNV